MTSSNRLARAHHARPLSPSPPSRFSPTLKQSLRKLGDWTNDEEQTSRVQVDWLINHRATHLLIMSYQHRPSKVVFVLRALHVHTTLPSQTSITISRISEFLFTLVFSANHICNYILEISFPQEHKSNTQITTHRTAGPVYMFWGFLALYVHVALCLHRVFHNDTIRKYD